MHILAKPLKCLKTVVDGGFAEGSKIEMDTELNWHDKFSWWQGGNCTFLTWMWKLEMLHQTNQFSAISFPQYVEEVPS